MGLKCELIPKQAVCAKLPEASAILNKTVETYSDFAHYEDDGLCTTITKYADGSTQESCKSFVTQFTAPLKLQFAWCDYSSTLAPHLPDAIEIKNSKQSIVKKHEKTFKKCQPEEAMKFAVGLSNGAGAIVLPLLVTSLSGLKTTSLASVVSARLTADEVVDGFLCYRILVELSTFPWIGVYFISKADYLIRKFENERSINLSEMVSDTGSLTQEELQPRASSQQIWFKNVRFKSRL